MHFGMGVPERTRYGLLWGQLRLVGAETLPESWCVAPPTSAPFFKRPDVKSHCEEEANQILQKLTIGVRVAAKNRDFGTILNAAK